LSLSKSRFYPFNGSEWIADPLGRDLAEDWIVVIKKTTDEIRVLLANAKMDFEAIQNEALNAYLPKVFHRCPFSEDVCLGRQCIECAIFKNSVKK
jgi:hypothetical protein